MIKRLSVVFKLSDSCLNRSVLSSEATIYVDGERYQHMYKDGGYFVLIDLPEGNHEVEIRSYKFQSEKMTVFVDNSTNFDKIKSIRYVMLNPSTKHPSAIGRPSVSGKIDGGHCLYIQQKGAALKIAEDKVEAGKTAVKLFGTSRPLLPSMFLITDKKESGREVVFLLGCDGDSYMLGSPLEFSHPRSTPLIPLSKFLCAEDGSFYSVLLSGMTYISDDGQPKIDMLIEKNGKITEKSFNVSEKGETQLGTI